MSKLNLVSCRATRWDDGYDRFRLRPDAAGLYLRFLAEVQERGGIVTSAGSFRSLEATGSASKSLYSLHKLGIAIDLDTDDMGMTSDESPYLCSLYQTRDEWRADHPDAMIQEFPSSYPAWTIWCLSDKECLAVRTQMVTTVRWKAGKLRRVQSTFVGFDFTALAARCGFSHIRPRSAWPGKYLAGEAHHLQANGLLEKGTTFLAEARKLGYTQAEVLHALPDAGRVKWNGRAFA